MARLPFRPRIEETKGLRSEIREPVHADRREVRNLSITSHPARPIGLASVGQSIAAGMTKRMRMHGEGKGGAQPLPQIVDLIRCPIYRFTFPQLCKFCP